MRSKPWRSWHLTEQMRVFFSVLAEFFLLFFSSPVVWGDEMVCCFLRSLLTNFGTALEGMAS